MFSEWLCMQVGGAPSLLPSFLQFLPAGNAIYMSKQEGQSLQVLFTLLLVVVCSTPPALSCTSTLVCLSCETVCVVVQALLHPLSTPCADTCETFTQRGYSSYRRLHWGQAMQKIHSSLGWPLDLLWWHDSGREDVAGEAGLSENTVFRISGTHVKTREQSQCCDFENFTMTHIFHILFLFEISYHLNAAACRKSMAGKEIFDFKRSNGNRAAFRAKFVELVHNNIRNQRCIPDVFVQSFVQRIRIPVVVFVKDINLPCKPWGGEAFPTLKKEFMAILTDALTVLQQQKANVKLFARLWNPVETPDYFRFYYKIEHSY